MLATKSRKTQSLSHTFVMMKKKMTDSQLLLIFDIQNYINYFKFKFFHAGQLQLEKHAMMVMVDIVHLLR